MAYLIVIRFEDHEKEKAQELADDYEDVGLVGAFRAPDENTPHCEHPRSESHNVNKAPESHRSTRGAKFGWWLRKCCNRPAFRSNHPLKNLRPHADPNDLIRIMWWNRPWKGEKSGDQPN